MKQFRLIQQLSEYEFEDFMFFKTDIPKNKSGLKFNISVIVNPYFNKNNPHIFVFKDNTLDFLNYKNYLKYDVMKLSPNPYLLIDNLNLMDSELNNIFEFVKINKKIIMKYWNWKCSSFELKDNIKGNK